MLHASYDEKTAQAAWFLQHKRRWPLAWALVLGLSATATSLLFGFGVAAAKANLPDSTASVLALERPRLDSTTNAAPLWDKAGVAFTRWAGPVMDDPDREGTWSNPSVYSSGSAFRNYLASNAACIALADQAAALPHANWDLDFSQGYNILLPFLSKQRVLARLGRTRARMAAFDNDWNEVLTALHTAHAAGVHAGEDPILINHLVAFASDTTVANALLDVLNTPGARPGDADLDRLLAFARACHEQESHLSESLEGERRIGLMMLDRLTTGDAGAMMAMYGTPSPACELPPTYNPLGLSYFTDRAAYDKYFERKSARLKRIESDLAGAVDLDQTESDDIAQQKDRLAHFFSHQILPTIHRTERSFLNRRAYWRVAIAGLLAYKHARAHGGRWPARLSDLGLGPAEVADPCDPNGGSIRYRLQADGSLAIWTVSADAKDNGGPAGKDKGWDDYYFLLKPLETPGGGEDGK